MISKIEADKLDELLKDVLESSDNYQKWRDFLASITMIDGFEKCLRCSCLRKDHYASDGKCSDCCCKGWLGR
jgi:hypothetical protein